MKRLKNKIIPAKKVRQFYKRFAQGEQYIELRPVMGIVEQDKRYYWQQRKVFNHIFSLIDLYGKGLTEEELYGRHGLVSLLEPYQREYNRIMNLHSEHISMSTYGYMAVEDGSVDADELCEEGLMAGKILVYRQGAQPPKMEKETINTKPYLESAEYCLDRMIAIAVDFMETHGKELQK
jgi:hypothetical protein